MFYLIFIALPILLLILFGLKWPILSPLTLLICPIVIFLVYHREFFYYESRGIVLLFTAAQLVLTAIPAFLIRAKAKSKEES